MKIVEDTQDLSQILAPYKGSSDSIVIHNVEGYSIDFRLFGENAIDCEGEEFEVRRFHREVYPDGILKKNQKTWWTITFPNAEFLELFSLISTGKNFVLHGDVGAHYCPYIPLTISSVVLTSNVTIIRAKDIDDT